jgi:tripartite-type tricarboxylate transporter receptor subunit TctC
MTSKAITCMRALSFLLAALLQTNVASAQSEKFPSRPITLVAGKDA